MKIDSNKIPCPVCPKPGVIFEEDIINDPDFGEIIKTDFECKQCVFDFQGYMIKKGNKPVRFTLKVSSIEDLDSKILIASSAMLDIPELGLHQKPGPNAISFLGTIKEYIKKQIEWKKMLMVDMTDNEKELAEKEIALFQRSLSGEMTFKITLDDPFSNSAMKGPNVKKEDVPEKQIEILLTFNEWLN